MNIIAIRHDWPEGAGFVISRPIGCDNITFLHFKNSVRLKCGGKTTVLQPDACIFYAPGTQQWFKSDTDLVHNWMHFEKTNISRLNKLGIKTDTVYYPANTDFITELFSRAENEFFSEYDFKEDLTELYFSEFLLLFSRAIKTQKPLPTVHYREREALSAVRNEILLHPERHLSVEEMAKSAYLSPSRFHTVYKSVFGVTPNFDAITARISKAKNMLIGTNSSIREISDALGYNNETHFIRQFKAITGKSPSVYRKSRVL